MSKYTDVYLLPIKEENVADYKKLAAHAGKIFVKHGALKYREYVASDLTAEGIVGFPKTLKLKPGETVIYAAVEFKSEAHRNKTMKKIFDDPALGVLGNGKGIFDFRRMVYGGFKVIIDL
jgi:uncharacterized protein YbaA (DUF1428 family)